MTAATGQEPTQFADRPAAERARLVDELLRPFVRHVETKYAPEQLDQLGRAVFERVVKPKLTAADDGKHVALDVESGEYEIGDDEFAVSRRLLVRVPAAQFWDTRVGYERTMTCRPGWTRA